MKKLLLILLCVSLIGLGQNKDCDKDPDYIMTVQDFIRTIENEKNNKKYDGKIFQFSIKWSYPNEKGHLDIQYQDLYRNKYYGGFLLFPNGTRNDDLRIDFDFDNFSRDEYKYCEELTEKNKKIGYNGDILTIKGIYSYDESELKRDNYKREKYQFINCCLVIPNKNNTNKTNSKIIENEIPIDTSEMGDGWLSGLFIWGVINDPDGYTNVRKEKSSKSEIVFKVYEGEEFEIIDDSDDTWWMIEYNGQQGYMYKDRIDIHME